MGEVRNPETQFNRRAWLILALVVTLLAYKITALALRFTLPTDGWQVNEATEVGFNYVENLMGLPSGLEPGDNVVAVEGNPAHFKNISPALRQAWQAGATLDYTIIRNGQELHIPVTLTDWQFGRYLLVTISDPFKLAEILPGYFLLALAAFVFLRRPGNLAAGALLLLFATMVDLVQLNVGWPEWIDPLASVFVVGANNVFYPILLPFALILFALVFPHPKPILQRHPWLALTPIAVGVILNVLAPYSFLGWYWFLISLALMVAILLHNAVTMRDEVSRAQILWGFGGLAFGFGLVTLMLFSATFEWIEFNEKANAVVSAIAFMVMGICLAIAITRYHLFDIDIIIRRTLIYTALTITLILVYFGSVVLLQSLVTAAGGQRSPVVTVISTLLIAALFTPLRRRIQNDIDRRFYRKKYDAEVIVAAFGASLREKVDLDELQIQVMSVVEETLQPEHLSLWLRPVKRPGSEPASSRFPR